MKKLFLVVPRNLVDMHETFKTLEDVQAKYKTNIYYSWESEDRFFIKPITAHCERPTMKGRGSNGSYY